MAASPPPAPVPTGKVGHRSPRVEQAKRTWYLFRRNTLALIGLAILVIIGLTAAYAVSLPLSWDGMTEYCATNYGPEGGASGYPGNFTNAGIPSCPLVVCTYEIHPPPNAGQFCGGQWYKTPYWSSGASYPSLVGPTATLSSPGPLPLGALSTNNPGGIGPFYNIYNGLLRGSDWSLIFSLSIVGMGAMIGLLVGAVAGFLGGWVDEILMRLVDIFLSIPVLLFVVVVVAVFTTAVSHVGNLGEANSKLLMLVLGFVVVWWPVYARIVRGQVLVVREQKYVEAARASGASKGRILVRHIVPNSVYPVFIQLSLDVGTIPLLIGALAFLGFSKVFFPTYYFPEWGSISAVSVVYLPTYIGTCFDLTGCILPWWQFLFPGLALFFFALSVNLLSDGLRDALDPRLRR